MWFRDRPVLAGCCHPEQSLLWHPNGDRPLVAVGRPADSLGCRDFFRGEISIPPGNLPNRDNNS
jgi:hypothetical protein